MIGDTCAGAIQLSVVMPARDAAATIGEALDALIAQEWDRPFEVVVVDNGSCDGSAEIARGYADRHSRVRVVDASERPGVGHARNVGIGYARSEAIAMCDADDVVGPGWVAAMGTALRDHELVAGRLDVDLLNPEWLAPSRGRAIASGPAEISHAFPFASTGNIGFRRSLARRVGGFDESLTAGEDIDFSLRLRQEGVTLTYVPDAVVHVRYQRSLGARWRQARRYGRAQPRLRARLRAAGIEPPAAQDWRRWLWLARHVGHLGSRRGRARWLWVAGGCVGELEGRWRTSPADRDRPGTRASAPTSAGAGR